MKTGALIFDMDGTMIDSMPWHWKSWAEFTRLHGIEIELAELQRRTNGKTGVECMRALFERDFEPEEVLALSHQKESIYRELFGPSFAEIAGFKSFAAAAVSRGLKVGVGTAGDKHNIAFAFKHLQLDAPPHAVVGGDEGLPGKPEPAIFLEAARRMGVAPEQCIVFEDVPHGMRAVAVCTGHSAEELAGPHVVAQVRDYHQLIQSNFLESIHA
jgi:beta-phosphoglucomutase-like phosphatase (HAD superfamily)